MQIESVYITGFRNLVDLTVPDLSRLNIFVGRNNSGKSSLLRAIDISLQAAKKYCETLKNPIELDEPFDAEEISRYVSHSCFYCCLKINVDNSAICILTLIKPSMSSAVIVHILPYSRRGLNAELVDKVIRSWLEIQPTGSPFEEYAYPIFKASDVNKYIIAQILLALFRRLIDNSDWEGFRKSGMNDEGAVVGLLDLYFANTFDVLFNTQVDELTTLLPKSIVTYTTLDEYREAYSKKDQLGKALQKAGIASKAIDYLVEMLLDPFSKPASFQRFLGVESISYTNLRNYGADSVVGAGSYLPMLLNQSKNKRQMASRYENFRKSFKQVYADKLDVFHAEHSSDSSKYEIVIDEDNIDYCGSGLIQGAPILFVCEIVKPSIVLIEEPESNLHPSQQRNMHRYLYNKASSCQIFITTHSPCFMENNKECKIISVEKELNKGNAIVETINMQKDESKIVELLGMSPTDLFLNDIIVFVEGISDVGIYRAFMEKFGYEYEMKRVMYIPLGGKYNALKWEEGVSLAMFAARRCKVAFILDGDSENIADEIRRRVGESAIVIVLARRQIENYLIDSSAIMKYITEMRGIFDARVIEDKEIEEEIEKGIEECKYYAKYKYVKGRILRPIHVRAEKKDEDVRSDDDVHRGIQNIIKGMSEKGKRNIEEYNSGWKGAFDEYEVQWAANKMKYVVGDRVIERVLGKYGYAYDKLDGEKLAEYVDEKSKNAKALKVELEELIKMLVSE